jgi:hypothetical protein
MSGSKSRTQRSLAKLGKLQKLASTTKQVNKVLVEHGKAGETLAESLGLKQEQLQFIRNAKQYAIYKRLSELKVLNESSSVTASDGRKINFYRIKSKFNRHLEGLPTDEAKRFKAIKSKFDKTHQERKNAFTRGTVANISNEERISLFQGCDRNLSQLRGIENEVIELFGAFYTQREIFGIIRQDYGLTPSMDTIFSFARRHKDIIEDRRAHYKSSIDDLRLSYKRSRIIELSWIYEKIRKKFNVGNSRAEAKLLVDILDQIKKEAEGDFHIKVDGQIGIEIEHTLNVHVQKQLASQMNLYQIIISRTAAKKGIDPLQMIHRLTSSFYSDFTQVNGEGTKTALQLGAPNSWPSNQEYDWDRIEDQHKATKEAELVRAKEIEKERSEKMEGKMGALEQLKQDLLTMTERKKK